VVRLPSSTSLKTHAPNFCPDNSGNSEVNSDYQTQLSVVNSDAPIFASSTQGLVEVTGNATITTNLGIEAPQSGIDLSPGPNGETISTVADPSGNYDVHSNWRFWIRLYGGEFQSV
jgi:hypothetical protein